MNKVIEADFPPRGTNADFSWPRSIGGLGMKEKRRISYGACDRAEAKSGLNIQGYPFPAKPVSIPELINAIEQHLPLRLASHVSL